LWHYVDYGKPTYLQWDSSLYEENKEFCRKLGNRVGYHFVLPEATFPMRINPEKRFIVEWQWLNDGVAPLDAPSYVAIALAMHSTVKPGKVTVVASSPGLASGKAYLQNSCIQMK